MSSTKNVSLEILRKQMTLNKSNAFDNFCKWFGHSKVVNEFGSPRVVYHATTHIFEEFKIGRETKNSSTFGSFLEKRMGIFFAEDPAFSDSFIKNNGTLSEGAHLLPVYLSLQNPLDLTDGFQGIHQVDFDKLYPFIRENYWIINLNPDEIWSLFDEGTVGAAEFIEAFKAAGFDGVKMIERDQNKEATNVWVALDPKQIKSATGNSGAYSQMSPSLTDETSRGDTQHVEFRNRPRN